MQVRLIENILRNRMFLPDIVGTYFSHVQVFGSRPSTHIYNLLA